MLGKSSEYSDCSLADLLKSKLAQLVSALRLRSALQYEFLWHKYKYYLYSIGATPQEPDKENAADQSCHNAYRHVFGGHHRSRRNI